MSKNIDFEVGTIVTAEFLDNLQDLLTGTINNIRLSSTNTANSMVALGLVGDKINDKLGTVNIGGKYVYFDQLKDCELPVPSTSGTYDIYLSTTEALAGQTPPAFKLSIGLPATYSFLRKIGTLSTTGSQVSKVKFNNGVIADADQYNNFTFKSVINTSGEVLLTLQGQTNQVSPAGSTVTSVSTSPTKLLSGGQTVLVGSTETYTEYVYLDSAGRFVWTGDLTLSRIDTGKLGTNAEISIRREGLNDQTGTDDPTLDGAETITRSKGLPIISGRINADTENRIQISQTGEILFGSGTATPDVGLYRPKADALALLTGDKLYLDYTVNYNTDGNNLAANKQYVDGAVSRAKLFDLFDVNQNGLSVSDGSLLIYDGVSTYWGNSIGLTYAGSALNITGSVNATGGNINAIDANLTGSVNATGGNVNAINANLTGSVYATGGNVNAINANLTGSVNATGGNINAINANLTGNVNAFDASLAGSVFATGGNVNAIDAYLTGSVYATSGDVNAVDVNLTGSVNATGGNVNAIDANLTGSVNATGGNVNAIDATFTGDISAVNAEFTGKTYHNGTVRDKVTAVAAPGVTVTDPTHNILLCQTNTGDITVTLPATAEDGDTVVIKDIDGQAGISNDLILSGDAGALIDGEADYTMNVPYDKAKLVSYNGNWFLI